MSETHLNAETIKAEDVCCGDVLLTPEGVAEVITIDRFAMAYEDGSALRTSLPPEHTWPVLRIGLTNRGVVRFPEEPVTVLRTIALTTVEPCWCGAEVHEDGDGYRCCTENVHHNPMEVSDRG